jgi:hypothetical protein
MPLIDQGLHRNRRHSDALHIECVSSTGREVEDHLEGDRGFADSPLEEAVCPKFPVSWENTGNFIDFASARSDLTLKRDIKSIVYVQIPYAEKQGIFCVLSGN